MADCISYKDIAYYSDLIVDYLAEKEELKFAYHRFPNLENFKAQVEEKAQNFSQETRSTLVDALKRQYKEVKASPLTMENLELLKDSKTFTITTGHQLNLFTGPLYFFYKIISVLNLTKQLKEAYPEYNFVPMYWLASEDHDFEEIAYFNYKGRKYLWETHQGGAVGRFKTKDFETVFKEFDNALNRSDNADYLRNLFAEGYFDHTNLTDATRYIANELLGKYGLVIIDGDDKALKTVFAPYVKDELLHQTSFAKVGNAAKKLADLNYNVQVNPREINLFYLNPNSRDRIVKEDGTYFIHDTDQRFSETEILELLEKHPERFSPNALLRPLYQEVVLPNLCYIGGSGELAYWFELKEYFEEIKVTFPILLMRNSALLMSEKQEEKCRKLKISKADLFLKQFDLLDKKTRSLSEIKIDFSPQKMHLEEQFKHLYELAEKTDKSFLGAVAAQEKKQKNGLDKLEKRLLKAQKKALHEELDRISELQDQLFPNANLQERTVNFSEFYETYGTDLIPAMIERLKPLEPYFDIIVLKDSEYHGD